MNRRYYWDGERGLTVIRRSPDARRYPMVAEVKAWMGSGTAPAPEYEPDRCPTCGRTEQCACPGCQYCGDGDLRVPRFRRRTDPTGTEGGPGDAR